LLTGLGNILPDSTINTFVDRRVVDEVTQQLGLITARAGNAVAVCALLNAECLVKIAKLKLELTALEKEVGNVSTPNIHAIYMSGWG
jgi:hypothetical protein